MQPLLYLLLRCTSALQLAPLQRFFDQIVPFYMGKIDKPFNPEKTGAIVIQVKNRKRPVMTTEVLREAFFKTNEDSDGDSRRRKTSCSSKTAFNPLRTTLAGPKFLFMLLDLDADKPGLDVSISQRDDPIIWAIHSRGRNKDVFRCLETVEVENSSEIIFQENQH